METSWLQVFDENENDVEDEKNEIENEIENEVEDIVDRSGGGIWKRVGFKYLMTMRWRIRKHHQENS